MLFRSIAWLAVNFGLYFIFIFFNSLIAVTLAKGSHIQLMLFFCFLTLIALGNSLIAVKSNGMFRLIAGLSALSTVIIGLLLGAMGIAPIVIYFKSFAGILLKQI